MKVYYLAGFFLFNLFFSVPVFAKPLKSCEKLFKSKLNIERPCSAECLRLISDLRTDPCLPSCNEICLKIQKVKESEMYFDSLQNDGSDACRHFMWSALLLKQFDATIANQILDNHEQTPSQSPEEKEMDSKNNKLGMDVGKILIKDNNFSNERLLSFFRINLEKRNVVIIKENDENERKDKK